VNFQVKDPKLSDSEDYVYEFIVPSNVLQIAVSLAASVKNLTKNKMESLGKPSRVFDIQHHRSDQYLYELYLRQLGPDYYVYCLGKNGEPCGNRAITLTPHTHE
jgi:hypothetical protein